MTPLRPPQHLTTVARQYPGCWQHVDTLRAQRGLGLPHWPDWCFLPLAGAVAVITRGVPDLPPELLVGPQIGIVGALAAWRVTQGIYRVDPDVFEALWSTPLEGELPTALLYHLPEWCVYVACPTPRLVLGAWRLHGWYAHLEWDANTHEQELRLLLDLETAQGLLLLPQALHLGEWSLGVAAQRSLATSLANLRTVGSPMPDTDAVAQALRDAAPGMAALCQPLVSVVLYLCSVAADVRDARGSDRTPQRPPPVRTKRGERWFPPAQPTTWEVAYRLGATLRQAQTCAPALDEEGEARQSRARPRPHIRRAHWHLYWTGTGRQTPRVRWLPPTVIGQAGEIVPTIHQVE